LEKQEEIKMTGSQQFLRVSSLPHEEQVLQFHLNFQEAE
jgi:hypothetical protein